MALKERDVFTCGSSASRTSTSKPPASATTCANSVLVYPHCDAPVTHRIPPHRTASRATSRGN